MSNDFYNVSGAPSQGSFGSSATMRAEFAALQAGFDKLPALSGNNSKLLRVNSSATGLEAFTHDFVSKAGDTITGVLAVAPAASDRGQLAALAAGSGFRITATDTANATYRPLSLEGSTVTLRYAGVDGLVLSSAGRVTINAPTSGTTLTVNGVASGVVANFNGSSDASAYTLWTAATAARGYVGASQSLITGGVAGDFALRAESKLVLASGGSTSRVEVGASGNVTVNAPSSGVSLTVNGVGGANIATFAGSAGSATTIGVNGSTTAGAYFVLNNSGGTTYIGISNSAGSALLASGSAYESAIVTESARDLAFGTNNTRRMTITSTGNVILNVNGAAPTLSVNSTMSFELTSNTSLKIVVRGTDGVTRSTTLTLA